MSNLDKDSPVQAHVVDLSGILDPVVLQKALEEQQWESNLTMAAGCTMATNPQDDMDDTLLINIDVSHVEAPTGILKEYLFWEIWRIRENES